MLKKELQFYFRKELYKIRIKKQMLFAGTEEIV